MQRAELAQETGLGDNAAPSLARRRCVEEGEVRVDAQKDELQDGIGDAVYAHAIRYSDARTPKA